MKLIFKAPGNKVILLVCISFFLYQCGTNNVTAESDSHNKHLKSSESDNRVDTNSVSKVAVSQDGMTIIEGINLSYNKIERKLKVPKNTVVKFELKDDIVMGERKIRKNTIFEWDAIDNAVFIINNEYFYIEVY